MFTSDIQSLQDLQAPDLRGRIGPTARAGTNLIGQQITLDPMSSFSTGQRLGGADRAFGTAGGLAGDAANMFRSSTQGLPAFQGVGAGGLGLTGQLRGEELSNIRGGGLPSFRGIGAGGPGEAGALRSEAAGLTRGGALPSFSGIGTTTFDPSGAFQRSRDIATGAVEGAIGAPSVSEAAQGQLANIFEQAEDARRLGARDIGRSAAAFGRIGSGVVNTELGNLEERIQRGQNQAFRELAGETAQADAADRLARAGLGLGASGQTLGQELDIAGFRQGLRGEGRGERAALLDDAFRREGLGLQRGAQLGDLSNIAFGQDLGLRTEARGERAAQLDDAFRREGLGLERAGALGDLGSRSFAQDFGLRDEARRERAALLDDAFRRAQLGQEAGRGLLGAGGLQADIGSRLGSLGALGQSLDLQRLGDLRAERGFQATQDQQRFLNDLGLLGAERDILGQDRAFGLSRTGQLGQFGFGGQPVGAGDLAVLGGREAQRAGDLDALTRFGQSVGGFFAPEQAASTLPPLELGGFNPGPLFDPTRLPPLGLRR